MLSIRRLERIILLAAVTLFSSAGFAEVDLDIITYGDSITAGLRKKIDDGASAQCRAGVALLPSLSGSGNLRCFGLGREGVGGYQPFLKDSLELLSFDVDIYNYGSSGIETPQMLSELSGVLAARPQSSYVLILGGANDAFDDTSSSTVRTNLQLMVNKVCEKGMIPVLGTITKILNDSSANSRVNSYNDRIRAEISAPSGCELIKAEQYDALKVSSSNYGDDGLHLSSIGNALMASVWYAGLGLDPDLVEQGFGYLPAVYLLLED